MSLAQLQAALHAEGINPPKWSNGNQKMLCPKCSSSRKNSTDKCFSLTIDGDAAVWNCHHCYWGGNVGSMHTARAKALDPKVRVYAKPKTENSDYETKLPAVAIEYLHSRKISDEAIERAKLMWMPRGQVLCFPYWGAEGELINIKHRPLKEKKFWLTAEAAIPFYGLRDVTTSQEIIIVEGEFDKLALNSCGLWNVVSVPHGAPAKELAPNQKTDKFDYLILAEQLLKGVRRVIIAVDDDPAGHVLEKELIRRIGAEKCSTVRFPCKDANDTLLACGIDIVLDCVNDAKRVPIKGLYEAADFRRQITDYFYTEMARGESTGWPNLDHYYTVMPGELTVVTGVPNTGKSEFLDALTVQLAQNSNWTFAVFSPENMKEIHVTKLMEKTLGISADPKSPERMSDSEFERGLEWVQQRYYFIVSDDEKDLPTIDWILEKAKIAVTRYGISGLIIDPYNEIEHKKPNGMQETEYVSWLLAKIKRFAKANQIHVWVIAHPAKMMADKDGKRQIPSLYDISGSANWANKADNGIVVHRGDTEGEAEIHVKKVRFKHVGRQGVANLLYNVSTGCYSVPESELLPPQPGKKRKGINSFIDNRDKDMQTFAL